MLGRVKKQPGVTSTVIEPRAPDELDDLLRAFEVVLTPLERLEIDELAPPGHTVPLFLEPD